MEGNDLMEILKEALRYRERGISVIPMTTYLDEEGKVKKKPIIAWAEFQSRLASNEEIKEWFTKNPKVLIGGVCGRISNICVADADKEEAIISLGKFLTIPNPKIPTATTPRPGNHFYFRPPDNCPGGNSTPMGLDFRGEGSLVILPPSINCQGKTYSWLPGLSLDEVEPPSLPEAYIEFIKSNSFSKNEIICFLSYSGK